jgi:hypothetical protein
VLIKNVAQSILFLAFGLLYSPYISATHNKPVKPLSPKMWVREKAYSSSAPYNQASSHEGLYRLVTKKFVRSSQRIIGNGENRKYLTHDEPIFINGRHDQRWWGIYRVVTEFERKGVSKKVVLLRLLALAELMRTTDNSSSLHIVMQQQEITKVDIVLPLSAINHCHSSKANDLNSLSHEFQARILGSVNGQKYSVTNQVVILDKGDMDNLKCGEELTLLEPSVQSQWDFPNADIGSVQVIQTYPYFSLALITQTTAAISSGYLAVADERKNNE